MSCQASTETPPVALLLLLLLLHTWRPKQVLCSPIMPACPPLSFATIKQGHHRLTAFRRPTQASLCCLRDPRTLRVYRQYYRPFSIIVWKMIHAVLFANTDLIMHCMSVYALCLHASPTHYSVSRNCYYRRSVFLFEGLVAWFTVDTMYSYLSTIYTWSYALNSKPSYMLNSEPPDDCNCP